MDGIRITQLKEAMKSILSELKEEDVFNIVEFNSIGKVWNVEAVAVQHESAPTYWYNSEIDLENPFKNRTVRAYVLHVYKAVFFRKFQTLYDLIHLIQYFNLSRIVGL